MAAAKHDHERVTVVFTVEERTVLLRALRTVQVPGTMAADLYYSQPLNNATKKLRSARVARWGGR